MSVRFNPFTSNFQFSGASQSEVNAIGDKYVRTTRFEIINEGTSGSVTLPGSSTVVLDDFGGTVDAVVSQVEGGKPLIQPSRTESDEIVATSFDSSGNWVFTGTPSSYPVAIIYRVRQKLTDFDSTATNLWGNSTVENSPVLSVAGKIGNVTLEAGDVVNAVGLHPNSGIEIWDDWISGTSGGNLGWTIFTNSGTVGANITAADGDHMGLVRLGSATTATSAPTISLGSGTSIILGNHSLTTEWLAQIPTLSTALEEYTIRFGLHSSVSSAAPSHAVIFEYDRTQSVNWRLRAIAGGSSTVTTSSTIVSNGVWTKFKIVINSDGTLATFYINDVSIGTVTTNIPVGNTQAVSPAFQLVKSVGTTDRIAFIDWFYLKMIYGE